MAIFLLLLLLVTLIALGATGHTADSRDPSYSLRPPGPRQIGAGATRPADTMTRKPS